MIVLDTHALIWALEDAARLGSRAREAIVDASSDNGVGVSAITLWEITLLVEKARLRLAREVAERVEAAFLVQSGISLLPIKPRIAVDSVRLPGAFHADPADRLIVATARYWNTPLIPADESILAYGETGHVAVVDAMR